MEFVTPVGKILMMVVIDMLCLQQVKPVQDLAANGVTNRLVLC